MTVTKVPEINLTDNILDNIIKMAPFLDEKKSGSRVWNDAGSGKES